MKQNDNNGGKAAAYRQENHLQEAWETLRFDRINLATTKREPIRIHHPGRLNTNQGPDFLDARIQIGDHHHHGHVELHLHADDWLRHKHHLDPQYNAVVLHVFLRHGKQQAKRIDGTEIPELFLGDRIGTPLDLTARFSLPCHGVGRQHLPPDPTGWMQEAGLMRISEKSSRMAMALEQLEHDWSQLMWEELAAAMGGPVNAPHFRQLARQVPWNLARRYNYSAEALEALLFGACGALSSQPIDPYQAKLREEWEFMQAKHGLRVQGIPFKFHRMHPAGFPTVRIAQLAGLAACYRPLIQLLESREISKFVAESPKIASDYWAYRYDFGNTLNERKSELGADSRGRIAVNVLIPLMHLYGHNHAQPPRPELLASLMQSVAPEDNKVVRRFGAIGLQARNALESQGLIQIEQSLCKQHRCLECAVGRNILAPGRVEESAS